MSRLEKWVPMALLPILIAPDPGLKAKARPVEKVDGGIRALMDDMMETMHRAKGIGLAAPQVGVLKRLIVVDVSGKDEEPRPLYLADPEVLWVSDETELQEEGCLSLPEHFADVTRPARVRVRYLDRENEIREMEADGTLGTCIQHEIDHLEGTLFVDRISALKRGMILRKLVKMKKAEAAEA